MPIDQHIEMTVSTPSASKAGDAEASLDLGLIRETLNLHATALNTALTRLLALEAQVRGLQAKPLSTLTGQPFNSSCADAATERKRQLAENTTVESQVPNLVSSKEVRVERTPEWWRGRGKQVRAIDPSRIHLGDCDFYHSMQFPDGSEVQGAWDIRKCFSDYIGNIDVRGKTLLDVGTASGIVAFETERRGALVTAYETPSLVGVPHVPFKSNLFYTDHTAWVRQADTGGHARLINGFWYAYHRFKSNVQVVYCDLFELADVVPTMDIVVAGAVLEHVSDPIRAIEVFSKIAKETIVLASTPIVESDELVMKSITQMDDPRFDYTWFAPSTGLLRRVFENVGFRITKLGSSRQFYRHCNTWAERPTIVAQRG